MYRPSRDQSVGYLGSVLLKNTSALSGDGLHIDIVDTSALLKKAILEHPGTTRENLRDSAWM